MHTLQVEAKQGRLEWSFPSGINASGGRRLRDAAMNTVKVLILHNNPTLPPDHPDAESERDVLNTVTAVSQKHPGSLRPASFLPHHAGVIECSRRHT